MACTNTVTQYVEVGYDYKPIFLRCGGTSLQGDRLQCAKCAEEMKRRYPQGWAVTPGDTCEHGTYVGDAYGPDILCGRCEMGE